MSGLVIKLGQSKHQG